LCFVLKRISSKLVFIGTSIVENYVVKIDLAADERDVYSHCTEVLVTRFMNENAKAATELVMKNTSIPVPVFVKDGDIHDIGPTRYFSVWKFMDGLSLEAE